VQPTWKNDRARGTRPGLQVVTVLAFLVGSLAGSTAAADGGWTTNGPYGAYVSGIAASPDDPSRVYVSTPEGAVPVESYSQSLPGAARSLRP
jgi:hypothetical protein